MTGEVDKSPKSALTFLGMVADRMTVKGKDHRETKNSCPPCHSCLRALHPEVREALSRGMKAVITPFSIIAIRIILSSVSAFSVFQVARTSSSLGFLNGPFFWVIHTIVKYYTKSVLFLLFISCVNYVSELTRKILQQTCPRMDLAIPAENAKTVYQIRLNVIKALNSPKDNLDSGRVASKNCSPRAS